MSQLFLSYIKTLQDVSFHGWKNKKKKSTYFTSPPEPSPVNCFIELEGQVDICGIWLWTNHPGLAGVVDYEVVPDLDVKVDAYFIEKGKTESCYLVDGEKFDEIGNYLIHQNGRTKIEKESNSRVKISSVNHSGETTLRYGVKVA